jgi:alkylation response protein AidB-like acyl-CoA dehydrogenase
MDLILTSYLIYILCGALLISVVGRILFTRGEVYLEDVFGPRADLAGATHQLLRVGFYLVLGGYILLTLKIDNDVVTAREVVEELSNKLGTLLLALGVFHLFNLLLLSTIRKNRLAEQRAERDWQERKKQNG